MVMPCSRSARRPSVSSEKSIGPADRFTDALLHRRELVFVDALGIVEQAADQGGLAVVHAARGGEAQQFLVSFCSRKLSMSGTAAGAPLEVALALLDLHGAFLVVVDDAVFALASGGTGSSPR